TCLDSFDLQSSCQRLSSSSGQCRDVASDGSPQRIEVVATFQARDEPASARSERQFLYATSYSRKVVIGQPKLAQGIGHMSIESRGDDHQIGREVASGN